MKIIYLFLSYLFYYIGDIFVDYVINFLYGLYGTYIKYQWVGVIKYKNTEN
jgi:hypothetical protein